MLWCLAPMMSVIGTPSANVPLGHGPAVARRSKLPFRAIPCRLAGNNPTPAIGGSGSHPAAMADELSVIVIAAKDPTSSTAVSRFTPSATQRLRRCRNMRKGYVWPSASHPFAWMPTRFGHGRLGSCRFRFAGNRDWIEALTAGHPSTSSADALSPGRSPVSPRTIVPDP